MEMTIDIPGNFEADWLDDIKEALNKLRADARSLSEKETAQMLIDMFYTAHIDFPHTGHWQKLHGYVTPGGDPTWCCSECGKGIHVWGVEHGTYGSDVSDGQWVACPNCGVVMKESR